MGKRGVEKRKPIFTDITVRGVDFQERCHSRYRAQAAVPMNIPLAQALLPLLSGRIRLLSGSLSQTQRNTKCVADILITKVLYGSSLLPTEKQLSQNTKIKYSCANKTSLIISPATFPRQVTVTLWKRWLIISKERSSSFSRPDQYIQLKGKQSRKKVTFGLLNGADTSPIHTPLPSPTLQKLKTAFKALGILYFPSRSVMEPRVMCSVWEV